MGNVEFSDFDSLFNLSPPPSHDTLLYDYYTSTRPDSSLVSSPWTDRFLSRINPSSSGIPSKSFTDARRAYAAERWVNATAKSAPKKRYKPVDRKVKPVATTQPDPRAHVFRPIPRTTLTDLPTHPPDYRDLEFGSRVTLERLEAMLAKIEPGILSDAEINLLSFIVVARESAFAFEYSEKGSFSRGY